MRLKRERVEFIFLPLRRAPRSSRSHTVGRYGALATAKRKPRRRKPSGRWKRLFAVRPVVEDEETDEERDGKAPRQKVEIHSSELVTAFDLLDDDGADDKGDGKAPRQKI